MIAAVGLYFLCIKDGFNVELGDLAVLVGAFFWACHILVIDFFVADLRQRDIIKLCVAQFLVAAALALFASPLFDGFFAHGSFDPAAIVAALPAILFTGVFSTGVAFTLQAIGQKGLNPTAASIIMSLESVFSLIFGMLLLGEILTMREALGCVLMFVAVRLSQKPVKEDKQVT
ncbi:MAG TPA: hypothetical protein DEB24_08305 [Coriobacteriia bacterium]|nr:hypothetical protein [Coriobacteriia bacterium]